MSKLVLVANARLPSMRAQSLQVMHAGAAFARAGFATTLLHAKRADTPVQPREQLLEYYGIDANVDLHPSAVDCLDHIDRVPRWAQFFPARMQEWTFAKGAAKVIRSDFAGQRVLSREIETAHALLGRAGLFLEIHRVPGGRLRRKWLLAMGEAAAGFVAISSGVALDLAALGIRRDRILVEHDAFDSSRFHNQPDRKAAREEIGVDPSQPLVVYTGGLLAWKGVDVLIGAARQMPDVQFVIAGGMEKDVARHRALAQGLQNVRLDGFQAPARVPFYLAAADVGVVPNRSQPAISAQYTSPLKIFEAMAVSLPLVVSDLPSMRDILGVEEAVFVPPDDPESLAKGLWTLLRDERLREKVGQALGARAPSHTFDVRARRLLDWMDSLEG